MSNGDFSFLDYGGDDYGDYGGYDYGTDYGYPDYGDFSGPGAGAYGDYGGWGEGDFDMGYGYGAEPDYGGEGWSPGSLGIDYTGTPDTQADYVDLSGTYGNPYAAYGSFAGPGAGTGTDISGYWDKMGGMGGTGSLDYSRSLGEILSGMPAAAGAAFKSKLEQNPIGTLANLLSTGMSTYSAYRTGKEREAAAKKVADAQAARQARWEQYGKPLNYRMDRQMLPPPTDLLTAGQRSGGINWFSPATFTPMAEGGSMARGGLSGLDGGQDDVIDIRAAPGEYVMDADTVANLGDGNNAAGAKKLDELRRRVREHKRKAPSSKIPPKAKSIEKYMKKKGD